MMVLHALWIDTRLHLWGEYRHDGDGTGAARGGSEARGDDPRVPFAASEVELRRVVGDVWESLLVSGATGSTLALLLPHQGGRPLHSWSGSPPASSLDSDDASGVTLQPLSVPTLSFDPADAVDLLTGSPSFQPEDIQRGASLRFWARVAELVLELLAKQRFVPAAHRTGPQGDPRNVESPLVGNYRGYWRVVVDDEGTSERLRALIVSMPPICRSMARPDGPIQASSLVENFLWTAVDSLVRRCLEGDELAHALQESSSEDCPPQMRWLKSLVRADASLSGTAQQRHRILETVQGWLSRLAPCEPERSCRTCFRLHPIPQEAGTEVDDSRASWRLTLHVQAIQDPALMLDATSLWEDDGDDPMILERPFAGARGQLRSDVALAARHFPALSPLAQEGGPLECRLTMEEAYRFLRDASPILKHEGFGVWLPRWWREDRPRLRMRLDIHPTAQPPWGEGAGSGGPPAPKGLRLDTLVEYDWRIALGDDDLSPEEISELAASKQPLVRLRGRWCEVQTGDLKAALAFVKRRGSGKVTIFEALRQYCVADDLETGLPVVGLRAHGWVSKLLDATGIHDELERVSQPAGFIGTLRPYQVRGLEWLSFLSRHGLGACLADDMGLGKTIQLIALWLLERQEGQVPGPTLLVVPMSLVGNWQREIARFGPSLRVMVHHGLERLTGQEFVDEVEKCDVVVSTYGLTHRDFDHLDKVDWHRIALDEAQNIKNPAAKQSLAIRSLRATHRLALTGTPVENRLSELWSILDFLNADYLGTAGDFRRRFAVPIERYHDADRAERLRHLIRPFVLRRRKSDPDILPDLPAKMEMKVFCNLTSEQAALYEAIVQDMLGQIDVAGGIQRRGLILATLVRLKQICNHPVQFLADGSSLPHRSGKCDRLTEMLEEVVAEGDHALIFTQFRQMGDLLQPLLQEALDREVLFLHGGTTQKKRDALVQRFQEGSPDAPLFILSLKAGGYGLNLTAASHVFHFDRWWNPAVEDQATDRAHRIGQHKQLQVHKFVCIGTLEERINDLLEHKRNLAETVIGGGEQWLTELSTDALRELFTLSREAVAED